jgi:dihydroflavonol-4-reductase
VKVLITGGSGFIGSRLAAACRERGDEVRILAQANNPAEEKNLLQLGERGCEIAVGSVVDAALVGESIRDRDVAVHLAAAQHEAGAPDSHFREVNVDGTRNVLEACRAASIKRLVHGSTIGVYRASDGVTVRDDTETVPDNIYGTTKLEGEQLVRAHADRVPAVIIRISETYGPGDFRLLKLFKGIQRGRYFHIGSGKNKHHPVYIDDLVRSFHLAMESPAAAGETMVVPGYDVVTTREMAEAIAEALEVRPPRLTVPLAPLWAAAVLMEVTLRPLRIKPPLHRRRMHFFVKSFEFSGEKARRLLGYAPQVPFREGAGRTAAWYRENGYL